MDYEKKYKETLKRAKEILECSVKSDSAEVRMVLSFFPELKESEDDRIRKELISYHRSMAAAMNGNRPCVHEAWIAWLEKQGEQKSMKVYRVENEAEQKGLWRKFDGTWQPLFDMLTDGKCKDMPMEDNPIYREGGKRWFASAPSKEALQKWFSKRDLEELVSKGFTISEFEVVGYKKVSDFEYIFTRDNIINRNYLEVSDIYSEQKDFAPKPQRMISAEAKEALYDRQEWSEEDETVLNNLTYALANDRIGNDRDEYISWLKSLSPQNRWKPSKSQLEDLSDAIEFYGKSKSLDELLEELKKL